MALKKVKHTVFDATGWQRVIPLLERDGYTAIAVGHSSRTRKRSPS
jgi:hypothetical protein